MSDVVLGDAYTLLRVLEDFLAAYRGVAAAIDPEGPVWLFDELGSGPAAERIRPVARYAQVTRAARAAIDEPSRATHYHRRGDHEYLAGGTEDSITITRLEPADVPAWLAQVEARVRAG